jgi:hypothetical protein
VPAVGYLVLAASSHPLPSIAGILLVAVPGLSRGPLFSSSMNRHIDSGERATVLSAIAAARTLAIGLVYPAAGVLMDWSLPWSFVVFAIAGLAAALAFGASRQAIEA